MKKIIGAGLAVIAFSAILIFAGYQNKKEEQMKHIVIFKYKPAASQEQIDKVTQAFKDLKNRIPGIVDFEHGINNSPENKNKGFTHVYLMTFTDAAARDTYLPHPEHQKFGQLLGELDIVEDVFVVDYIPEE